MVSGRFYRFVNKLGHYALGVKLEKEDAARMMKDEELLLPDDLDYSM